MPRNEFINKLKDNLKMLPQEDIDSAVSYYEEYFDEAGEGNVQAVLDELGSPSVVASKVIGEYSLKEIQSEKSEEKKPNDSSLKLLWIVLIAFLVSPIAIIIFPVIFAIFMAVFVVLFTFFIVGIALSVASIGTLIGSVVTLFIHFPTAIFMLGTSLFTAGLGVAFVLVGWWVIRSVIRLLTKVVASLLVRRGTK